MYIHQDANRFLGCLPECRHTLGQCFCKYNDAQMPTLHAKEEEGLGRFGLTSKHTLSCTAFLRNSVGILKCRDNKLSSLIIRTYRRLRKDKLRLFWILHEIMELLCISANVRQCIIAYNVLQIQLYFKSFLFVILLLSCQ